MNSDKESRYPLQFFCLLFFISIPFWLYGAIADGEFLPRLPISASMVVCPAIVSVFLVWRVGGKIAIVRFFLKAADCKGVSLWIWLVATTTMPLVMLVSGVTLTLFGQTLPRIDIQLIHTLFLLLTFFIAAILEELGWTGYVSSTLITQRGLLVAGLIIGTIAVIWHAIPLIQAERDYVWIAWWALGTICRRILILWLYVQSEGRVVIAALFHTMSNLSWMLFPVMGSHYDPISIAIILLVPVSILAVINRNSRKMAV